MESIFAKLKELWQTIVFFRENDIGMMSVCSVDQQRTSTKDMLEAVKPYAAPEEQEMIDLLERLLSSRHSRNGRSSFPFEQFLSIIPPEQQAKLETIQLMMQTLNQF